jgi:hypothetical protein
LPCIAADPDADIVVVFMGTSLDMVDGTVAPQIRHLDLAERRNVPEADKRETRSRDCGGADAGREQCMSKDGHGGLLLLPA